MFLQKESKGYEPGSSHCWGGKCWYIIFHATMCLDYVEAYRDDPRVCAFFYLGTLNGREPTTNEVTKYLNFHDHSQIHDEHYLFVDSGVSMVLKDR